jgi:hypothetical protein
MVCPNCGYDNSKGNRFCVRCGVDISVAPPPEPSSFASDPASTPTPPPPAPGFEPAPPSAWGAPPPAPPGSWSASGPTPPPGMPPPSAPPNPFAPPAPYAAPGAYAPPGAYGQYPPPYPPAYPPPYGYGYGPTSTNGLAIASLVLGLLGWAVCGLGSVIAVVLGFVARSQIRSSNGRQGGDGLARAGIVLGFVGIGLVILWFVLIAVSSSHTGQT